MSITTNQATEGLFEVARRAPFNIAPEKGERLALEIFGSGKWSFKTSQAEANFFALPEEAAVYLPYAGLASLWCLSYVAFHLMDIASRRQRTEIARERQHFDIGDYAAALRLGEYVAYARNLCHHDQDWPANLATPRVDALLDSPEGRVNNVFFGALSWMMLHEIAHVHHNDQKHIPYDQLVRQEYRADDFATRWVLGESGSGPENEFRVLMISIALTWLFMHEAEMGRGPTHPPAILRLREAAQHFRAGQCSVGLENAAYVFKAVLDPETPPPAVDSAQEMFEWVVSRLETKFPVR